MALVGNVSVYEDRHHKSYDTKSKIGNETNINKCSDRTLPHINKHLYTNTPWPLQRTHV